LRILATSKALIRQSTEAHGENRKFWRNAAVSKFPGQQQKHFLHTWPRALRAAFCTWAICVGSGTAFAQVDGVYFVHSANPGDKLINLAKRYLVNESNWQSLQKLNKIADPRFIKPGTPIRIPLADMKTVPSQGTVVSVEGPAESAGAKLAAGSAVKEGQEIKTGDNGFVTIKLADGSTMVVQSKSTVKLEVARTIASTDVPITRTTLSSGRVEANVQKRTGPSGRFEINTPTSNMGVRGTRFRVSSDDAGKSSRGEVLEGTVNVADATVKNALDLGAGFGTLVEQGKPPVPPVKLLAPPDLSATPKLHERTLLRFKFADTAGASGYRAQIATDSAFNNLRAESVFKTPEAKFADLADGKYFLRLRAIDKLGIEGDDAVLPFTLKARPEPPFTSAPPNKGKFAGEKAEFAWAKSTEAATYRFQLASDVGFTKVVADEKSIGENSYTTAAKINPGEYFWRVASIRADGDNGPFGDVQSFTLKPLPPTPNPPKEDGNRVGFSWGAEPEQKFEFQLARDAAFKNMVTEQKLDKPEISIEKPDTAGTYFMRFRSIDPDGFISPYSAAQSFEVKSKDKSWLMLLLLAPLLF
jgi:hypothetical protein